MYVDPDLVCFRVHSRAAILPPPCPAEAGAAAVQLTSDGALVKVPLDEVAEYVGPEQDGE